MAAEDRTARQRYAAAQWVELRDRLRTVTPQAVARSAIAIAAVAGAVAVTRATWPALLPFFLGGLVAYELLPIVDALDRVMPRFLAAVVAVVGTVAIIVGIAILVLPPLATTFVRFAQELPTSAEIDQAVARLQGQLGSLPEGSAAVVVPVLAALAGTVRDAMSGSANGLDDVVRTGLGALLNAVGALLGLIVLPTWMLGLLSQKRRAQIAVNQQITPSLRTDAWAIAAIVDRAAGSYTRGYVVSGILVGALTYILAGFSPRLGGPTFSQPGALAVFAGVSQVIPIVGPILGFVPAVLIAPLDPGRAVAYLVIYVVARIIGGSLLGTRLQERRLGVHPAILVPGVVTVGQLGPLWLLLSAPIVAIVVGIIRYVHGRLSEPPRPAGLLPGEPIPVATVGSSRQLPARSVYRPAEPPRPIVSTATTTGPPVS
jgi:predicted PurR-regulated permease PerM